MCLQLAATPTSDPWMAPRQEQPVASEQDARRQSDYQDSIRQLAVEALGWPHLPDWRRLEWGAALLCDAVPVSELPPWFVS